MHLYMRLNNTLYSIVQHASIPFYYNDRNRNRYLNITKAKYHAKKFKWKTPITLIVCDRVRRN